MTPWHVATKRRDAMAIKPSLNAVTESDLQTGDDEDLYVTQTNED